MLTFFRSHWVAIAICLVYTLAATGVAYYFSSSAIRKSKVTLVKVTEALKTAKAAQEQSSTEATKAGNALNQEAQLNAALKKKLEAAEQERESLRSALETMSKTVVKATPSPATKVKTAPTVSTKACEEKKSAAADELKKQMQALRVFEADVYRRDSELRERQKQLDDEQAKLAAEQAKTEKLRSEYRWPHNGTPSNK